jgi:hypothetical protein
VFVLFSADYYQYTNWNSHTPAIASCVSFMLLPIMLESLGWIYGVLGYCLVHTLILDKLMEMSIEFRYSKINQGATWGVIISLFAIFVRDLQSYVHTNTCAFVYVIFITICVLNVLVTNAAPKYVESGEDRAALIAAMMDSSPQDGPLPANPNADKDSTEGGTKSPALLEAPEVMDRGMEVAASASVSQRTHGNSELGGDLEEGR